MREREGTEADLIKLIQCVDPGGGGCVSSGTFNGWLVFFAGGVVGCLSGVISRWCCASVRGCLDPLARLNFGGRISCPRDRVSRYGRRTYRGYKIYRGVRIGCGVVLK